MNAILTEVVAEILSLTEKEVTGELTPDLVGSWDSLNHLRLITAVEAEFDISLSMAEIRSIDSLSKLSELVDRYSDAPK